MTVLLYIIGISSIISGLVLGVISGTFWGFFIAFTCGIATSVLYFTLTKVLENQENIKFSIQYLLEKEKIEKKTCAKCGYKYDEDSSSCPHCGHRDKGLESVK